MPIFEAKRVAHSATITVDFPFDKVFPLFDPENEKKWAHEWQYTPLFPREIEKTDQDFVFSTAGEKGEPDTVWVLSRFERESGIIEYVRFEPERKVVHIHILCQPVTREKTQVGITYILTSVTQKGDKDIEGFTAAYYDDWIQNWGKAISHYLETRETLQIPT